MNTYNKFGLVILGFIIVIGGFYYVTRDERKIYAFHSIIEKYQPDELCIVHSYTVRGRHNTVNTKDGRRFLLEEKWHGWPDDNRYVAIFLKNNNVIDVTELPGEFAKGIMGPDEKQCIKANEYKGLRTSP